MQNVIYSIYIAIHIAIWVSRMAIYCNTLFAILALMDCLLLSPFKSLNAYENDETAGLDLGSEI